MGTDIGIGIDFHGRVHKPMAKVLAKELEKYRPMFIEEPVLAENNEAFGPSGQCGAAALQKVLPWTIFFYFL